jgi:hypothetical protein
MGLLERLFGGRVDPESVPVGPVAAVAAGYATFWPGRVTLRFVYSPHPRHADDAAAVFRAFAHGMIEDGWFTHSYLEADYSRFAAFCRPVPDKFSGPVPMWVRDATFRRSDLPRDFEDTQFGLHPVWLRFDSPRAVRFLEKPADTPAARAGQRIARVRARKGVPVRAALVQANGALFGPGPDDLPGLVLFSIDDRVGDDDLLELAERVSDLKNTTPADPDRAFVAGLTTDERFVYYGRDLLPRSFAGNREVYAAHLHFHRGFLPAGYILGRMFDCVAEPGARGMLELLPQPAAGITP